MLLPKLHLSLGLAALLLAACSSQTSHSGVTPAPVAPTAAQPVGSTTPAATVPAPSTQTPAATAPAAATGPFTPVLLVLGGYTSCDDLNASADPRQSNMTAIFTAVNSAMTQAMGTAPAYLLSCFTADNTQVVYSLSTDGSKAPTTIPVGTLATPLQGLLATVTNPAVYVIGHSYGGWTAINTLLNLPASVKLGGLITLDPISNVDCRPDSFVAVAFGGSVGAGCLRAPTDFADASLIMLAKELGFWRNYYETASALLHSGPIADATLNVQEPYTGTGFTSHNAFTSDNALIAKLSATITAAIAGTPLPN